MGNLILYSGKLKSIDNHILIHEGSLRKTIWYIDGYIESFYAGMNRNSYFMNELKQNVLDIVEIGVQ